MSFDSLNMPATPLVSGVSATALANWLDTLLSAKAFNDYCPNGLQVDAGNPIHHIVTGVTASEALIQAAIEQQAQAILVHHGYFWKGEPPALVGIKGKRVRLLMQHGISLLAYHLPLDAHPVLGNNAQLANLLGLTLDEPLYPDERHPVGNIANLVEPLPVQTLIDTITTGLQRPPLHLSGGHQQLRRIGICTGAAQDMLEQAAARGCDAFISGEVSERTTHSARELGIDYFACGHHATERGGTLALGTYLQQYSDLKITFIDIDNPV